MVFGRKRYLKQSAHPEDGEEIHCLLGEGCYRVRDSPHDGLVAPHLVCLPGDGDTSLL